MADDTAQKAHEKGHSGPFAATIDRVLSVQRPAVLAHLRHLRRSHPDATPEELVRLLEKRYLQVVTLSGGAVGGSAFVPGLGTAASVGLSGVETLGFLEASAMFVQSVTEVHGIAVEDPVRARGLVMTLMLGGSGGDLLKRFLKQQGRASALDRGEYMGQIITENMSSSMSKMFFNRVRQAFLRRMTASFGTGMVGRAFPFGIGAVLGAGGNRVLGKQVVEATRRAFPPVPSVFPVALQQLEAGRGKQDAKSSGASRGREGDADGARTQAPGARRSFGLPLPKFGSFSRSKRGGGSDA